MKRKELKIGQIRKMYHGNRDLYLILDIATDQKKIYVFKFEDKIRLWWTSRACIKDDVLVG